MSYWTLLHDVVVKSLISNWNEIMSG